MPELAVLTPADHVRVRHTPLPLPVPGVVFQHVPGGAVLLSTADEVYYGLNAVGALIWEALPPIASTVEETCARLQARFPQADPALIRHDVVTLLESLCTARLVRYPDANA